MSSTKASSEGAFGPTKEITDTLAGVALLREHVARLPTSPWPPQVLRGFLSALLAPIVVYVPNCAETRRATT